MRYQQRAPFENVHHQCNIEGAGSLILGTHCLLYMETCVEHLRSLTQQLP